jgi:LCP family protein required for cell wall assembly
MKWLTWKSVSITIFLLLGVATFAAISGYNFLNTQAEDGWINTKNRINFLLLGTDEKLGSHSRTDTIIIASLDTVNNTISLLSIPRDTRVDIPGYGVNKINSANQLGGIDLVKEIISNLIKVPIDYYVLTNFNGFKEIVDTLGGVTVNVEQNMQCHVYDGDINIKKGLQRLNGDKALQYVRFRHDKLGDISRTQRQQKFLAALSKEITQPENIVKLPLLAPKIKNTIETDLGLPQMISLTRNVKKYDLENLTVQTLPGNFVNEGGTSYWLVDEERAHQVALQVFAGQSQNDIIDTNVKLTEKPNHNISGFNQYADIVSTDDKNPPISNKTGKKHSINNTDIDTDTDKTIITPDNKTEDNIDSNSDSNNNANNSKINDTEYIINPNSDSTPSPINTPNPEPKNDSELNKAPDSSGNNEEILLE